MFEAVSNSFPSKHQNYEAIPSARLFMSYIQCTFNELVCHHHQCVLLLLVVAERNSLSFIETSALDSTNVEQAFVQILTGKRGLGYADNKEYVFF